MPIEEHPIHIKLDEDAILWRYMSYSKFESLLKDKSLFFCRADKFSDPFECSVTKREAEYRASEDLFRKSESVLGWFDSKFDKEIAKMHSEDIAALHKKIKTATTVNCWHINNHESDAMWQLYLKNNEGISVKTNTTSLFKALDISPQKIGISKVRYIDYETGFWFHKTEFPNEGYNLMTPLIHKRLEFKHECELRLYCHSNEREKPEYWDAQPNNIGEYIPVEINTLVVAIVFHPTADRTTKEKIICMTKSYGYNFKFQESKMSIAPTY